MDWIIRKWRNQDAKNLANALNNKKIQEKNSSKSTRRSALPLY